jgi:hypothetical protein
MASETVEGHDLNCIHLVYTKYKGRRHVTKLRSLLRIEAGT